uniref:RanBP2-type domain-containing protein n=1 Tax=Globisporangium ultimum (strain ATCC 200006 / CBS 805.95 / DAOM BR144) TaxID=431595 RepID=K3WW35_GLOUD
MSWQNTWGTVKATNAKACALYYEIANVGKTIESSKKRVIWRLKVEEGREFEIILTHSLASGKKILRVDGIIKYTSQSLSFGDWDHVFNLPGGYVVHIIIKPSVELNDMYDLIIDGMSFRRLPDRLDPNRAKSNGGAVSTTSSSARTGSGGAGGLRANSHTYNYSNGGNGYSRPSSRESSFSPWPCSRCTLVNEKPLAPICEACGAPKPDYISPEDRQRARETVEHRSAAPVSRTAAPKSTGKQRSQSNKASKPGFFSTPSASAPDNSNGFGAFGSDPFAASSSSSAAMSASFATNHNSFAPEKPATTADISSMLSGLDFTAVPVQPALSPDSMLQSPSSPNPADDSNARTASGDLWDSKMVDLDLNPKAKQKPVSAKSYQTLEQARLQAPKEKVAVLPTPPAPVAVSTVGFYGGTATMPPSGYYQQAPGMMQQPMYNTSVSAGYGMAPPNGGYGAHFGAPQQQFMTQMQQQPGNNGFPPSKPNAFGSDPFATLS